MAPDLLHHSLEDLLLFQALQQSEEQPPSFSKISDALKTNGLLTDRESYVEDRLEPDLLRRNYLRLLKEEVKLQSQRDNGFQDGGQSPRKRKRSSPLLETAEEALQYAHLIPQLTNRLYFRFQEGVIESLKDEERTYRSLQAEIQEIERGEREARLQLEHASRRDSRGVSSIQTLLRHDDEDQRATATTKLRPTPSQDQPNGHEPGPHVGIPHQLPTRYIHDPHNAQSPPLPPVQKQAQQHSSADKNAPFLPPLSQVNHGFSAGSPGTEMHRRLPHPNQVPSHPPPSPSPRSNQNSLLPERTSASPIILPPPPGMLGTSGSPTGPLDALADMAGQQYRNSPSMPSPRPAQHAGSKQQPHQPAQNRFYMPRPYPHPEHQPPYQAPYPAYGQSPYAPPNYQYQGQMPPYQNPMAAPTHGSPYSNLPPYQPPMPPYSQHPGYSRSPGYYQQSPIQTPYPRGPVSRFQDQHTPVSTPSGRQRPSKPTPITTSASSTRWKNVDAPNSVRQPSPRSPSPGAVSPISEKAPSPVPEAPPPPTEVKHNEQMQNPAAETPSGAIRGRAPRGRGRGSTRKFRGGRTASAESSAHAGSSHARTRSQSVVSQVDELAIDQPVSTRRIKPEPSGTSVNEDDASIASPAASEIGRKSTRKRRGTMTRPATVEGSHAISKRKREESPNLPPPSPAPTQVSKPGFVLGTRNLPRTSTNLINDILAHKVGNMFSKPLTDREAPGYKDLIYRPQDIKTIKAAITAGSKALLKAAEATGENASSTTVWVPETPDVVPPKGIVNSAQLEKELMRMFANAVMFNPDVPSKRGFGPALRTRRQTMERGAMYSEDEDHDDEGITKGKMDVSVVKDTREMFEAVETKVTEWRGAERGVEEVSSSKGTPGRLRGGASQEADEADELAGDGNGNGEDVLGSVEQEETPEPKAKRRRR